MYEEQGEFERADGRIAKEIETGPTDQLQSWEQRGQHKPGGVVWGLLRGESLLRDTASVRASGESRGGCEVRDLREHKKILHSGR